MSTLVRSARGAASHARGKGVEARAAAHLQAQGWDVREQRWRCEAGEIDLIAQRGECLVFIEVKQRATIEEALYSLTPRQRGRIMLSAQCYLATLPEDALAQLEIRFDLIACTAAGTLEHLEAAWEE